MDEIDALTKTSYSDQIFAQIRSIYFSRVNFEELSRLTYLLSGVMEPTDIIKDPKISPFNIGQKIFLNDFSKQEFLAFLSNAKINIDNESLERIFYWTNGNPRMTWDLCSEIENEAKEEKVNNVLIDKVVNEIYLTAFDKPPVDNIRELVKNDREIRNAVIDIGQEKGKYITDKLKSKLYLSGIINYEENNVQIKNNIIKESLNPLWIKSLELEEKGLFESALTLIEKGKNREALEVFEKFLEGDNFEENQRNLCYYNMTYALIQLSNFERALHYSELIEFDKEDEIKWFYRSKIQKGLIHYYLGNIEKSLAIFKEIIDSGRKDELFARALLNYGTISLKAEKGAYKDEATKIFEDIISEKGFEKGKLKEDLISELKSIAYYNLAQLFISDDKKINAKESLHLALSYSKDNNKPIITLSLLEIEENIEEQIRLIRQVSDLILFDKISPTEIDPEKPLDFTFSHFQKILLTAYIIDKEDTFNQLKRKFSVLGNNPYYTHIFDLAVFAINEKLFNTGIELLNELYTIHKSTGDVDKKTTYNSLKLLAYLNDNKKSVSIPIEYTELLEVERVEKIDYLDFEIITNLIFRLIDKQKYKDAVKYVSLINSLFDEVDSNIIINFLVVYHLELNIYLHMKNNFKVIETAKKILIFADNNELKHQRSHLLGDTGLEIIKQNAENIINPKVRQVAPIRTERTYGRNDLVKVRYKDGRVLTKKFKILEEDIKKEYCIILTE